jgi:hypothetical protein
MLLCVFDLICIVCGLRVEKDKERHWPKNILKEEEELSSFT